MTYVPSSHKYCQQTAGSRAPPTIDNFSLFNLFLDQCYDWVPRLFFIKIVGTFSVRINVLVNRFTFLQIIFCFKAPFIWRVERLVVYQCVVGPGSFNSHWCIFCDSHGRAEKYTGRGCTCHCITSTFTLVWFHVLSNVGLSIMNNAESRCIFITLYLPINTSFLNEWGLCLKISVEGAFLLKRDDV